PGAALGKYDITVSKLATATMVTSGTGAQGVGLGGKIDSTAAVVGNTKYGLIPTEGTFTINGTTISIAAGESLDTVITNINNSAAGVTAAYDPVTDKFTITGNGGAHVTLGAAGDTSNFLAAMNLTNANEAFNAGLYSRTSTVHLGKVDPNESLLAANTNMATPITGDGDGNGAFFINGVEITYNVNTDTLNSIITRINNSNANVVAAYDSTSDRLILTSKDTGSTTISRAEGASGNFLAATGLLDSSAGVSQVVGTNAEFTISGFNNGNTITSASNTVSGIIPGVTLNLKATSATATTLTIGQDTTAIKNTIKEFVNKYNDTITLINNRLTEKKVAEPKTDTDRRQGLLRGEWSLIKAKMDLAKTVTDSIPGLPEAMNQLALAGIQIDSTDYGKSGKLVIDEAKLDAALRDRPEDMARLFFNDTDNDGKVDTGEDGVAVRFDAILKRLTDLSTVSYNGVTSKYGDIPREQEMLDSSMSFLDAQIEKFEVRMDLREQQLVRQYTEMEKALTLLQSQGGWLQGQIAKLY
ncbi:MAG: flagellar filament capping protein FliD, partial [Syntrophothermus sp.]